MKFDMHCHTKAGSLDASIEIKKYIEILKSKGFSGMLITDHDSYRGYYKWLENKEEMPEFVVLKGIEYDTKDAGHFIVIMPDNVNLKVLTNRGMTVDKLIDLVHSHKGVLGPAHPFGQRASSAMFYKRIKKDPSILARCDFLEGFNVCDTKLSNILAQRLAKDHNLICIGGSDSHKQMYVGMGYTEFGRNIYTNNDLIAAIKEKDIIDFGGSERLFLKKHKKRNSFYATWSFRFYNKGLGMLFAPIRKKRLATLKKLHKFKNLSHNK